MTDRFSREVEVSLSKLGTEFKTFSNGFVTLVSMSAALAP